MTPARTNARARRRDAILPAACLVTLLGSIPAALAQAPVPVLCDQTDSGERIKCKFGNIIEQQRGAADLLGQMGMLPPGQQEALTKHVDRAGRGQARSDAMNFKQLTRKSQVACQIKELLGDAKGDDDGLCSSGEDCEEVIGDQIGNDDGVCRPQSGNNREVCVEICDAAAINLNPENFDDDPATDSIGRDLEESLDDLTDQYEEINTMMAQEVSDRTLDPSPSPAASTSGACDTLLRGRPSSVVTAILIGAAAGARVSADVGERFCDQSAFGFSGSSVCAVIEGIAGAANVIATAYQAEDDDISDATIDAIWACLKETAETTSAAVGAVSNVSGDLEGVSLQIGIVDERVDNVSHRVTVLDQKADQLALQIAQARIVLAEVLRLLSTPQGRRPGFNTR